MHSSTRASNSEDLKKTSTGAGQSCEGKSEARIVLQGQHGRRGLQ